MDAKNLGHNNLNGAIILQGSPKDKRPNLIINIKQNK
uniref:Uncharacterized protein n=1 Tax=Tetranychus urticae TaxID=32264 RepID=T1KTZ4_TETUR